MNPDPGVEYASYIEAELMTERARTDRLVNRATHIEQLSGAIVAVFAALFGLADQGALHVWSKLAFALFVTSVAASLVYSLTAGWSRGFAVSDANTFERMTTDKWSDSQPSARRAVATARAAATISLREANSSRVKLIDRGGIALLVALISGAAGSLLRATGH